MQTSTSLSQSRTTSTTTIFGPTFTASVAHSKRSATEAGVVPIIGTRSFSGFPTDAPVPVGAGPICIVYCEWARMQNSGKTYATNHTPNPSPGLMPAIRPTSDSMTTSTMISVSKSTIDMSVSTTLSSMISTTSPSLTTSPPLIVSIPTDSPFLAPPPALHRPSAGRITGFALAGLFGLAVLLGLAWLITRQIRKVKAKLNKRTMGVHRDLEREIHERDGGRGIPEMGRSGGRGLFDGEPEAVGSGKGGKERETLTR
ncbi:MAG: hypothetical protein Q9201_002281 [Fulgogasparrea decipioides]